MEIGEPGPADGRTAVLLNNRHLTPSRPPPPPKGTAASTTPPPTPPTRSPPSPDIRLKGDFYNGMRVTTLKPVLTLHRKPRWRASSRRPPPSDHNRHDRRGRVPATRRGHHHTPAAAVNNAAVVSTLAHRLPLDRRRYLLPSTQPHPRRGPPSSRPCRRAGRKVTMTVDGVDHRQSPLRPAATAGRHRRSQAGPGRGQGAKHAA